MTDLAARYGTPHRARKPVIVALTVLLAAAGLSWVAWAAVYQSTPRVTSDLVRFDVTDPHHAKATFTVVRRATDTKASCTLQAIATDHSIVGELDVPVTSGPKSTTLSESIRTERRATAVTLLGCVADGQAQRR
jgi:hypothetical protein